MTNNGGFTLGGIAARQIGIQMTRDSQRPILPPTVDLTMQIEGRSGLLDFGAGLGPKPFDLDCALITKNEIALQQVVSNLAAFLVDQTGKPRTLEIIFDYQPDRKYHVRYSGSLSIARIVGLGRFVLPFVAFDPYAYALVDQIYQDVITTKPFVFEVMSNGNINTPCVIELTNEGATTITSFTIRNEYLLEG